MNEEEVINPIPPININMTMIACPIGDQNLLVFSTISPVRVKDDVAVNNAFIIEFCSGWFVETGSSNKIVSKNIIER